MQDNNLEDAGGCVREPEEVVPEQARDALRSSGDCNHDVHSSHAVLLPSASGDSHEEPVASNVDGVEQLTEAGSNAAYLPDRESRGSNLAQDLPTKPTGEETSSADTDEENPSKVETDAIVAAATAAAVSAVAAVSSQPDGTRQKERSVQFSATAENEPTKSSKPSLEVDTGMPPDDTPKEVGSTLVLSPAESTLATEPSTPSSTVHTIEHRHVTKKKNRSASVFLALRKPAVALIGLYLLGITGAGVFLASQYATIPGLNEQIEDLKHEVDRLEEQVDRLEIENDRFEELNSELAANNEEYSRQNDRLEASNAYYASLNKQLNASNNELERLNTALNASNAEYARLNVELTETTRELGEQVDILEVLNANLTDTLIEYIALSEGLSNETDRLDQLNDDLSENLLELNSTLSDLRGENNRLHLLLNDLTTITSFLNETAAGLEQSYEAVAKFLAEQIVANRAILLETLHNTYRQQTINWVCGLELRFATEPFVADGAVPIGSTAYPEVMEYIDKNVLSELCLDTNDFESFLAAEVDSDSSPPTDVSSDQIISAVMMYSMDAMDYYFPDAGETGGLSGADWADASFRCERLPQEKRFLHKKALWLV